MIGLQQKFNVISSVYGRLGRRAEQAPKGIILILFVGLLLINRMNQQNNADDSMNFSVIDKNTSGERQVDFSVQSILENNEEGPQEKEEPADLHTTRQHIFDKIKQISLKNGKSIIHPTSTSKHQTSQQFLRDLSRMEKELSFETESYNIYEQNPNNSTDNVQNSNKSKTLSYLKVTKDTNKSISRDNIKDYNDYYGYLIIDFHEKPGKIKEKVTSKTELKVTSNNISNENSQTRREKSRKNSKNKGQVNAFFRLKQKKSPSKSKFIPQITIKSKSKSINHKFEKSKSKSHLKSSHQCDNLEEKVFTEYYGTDINFRPQRNDLKKKSQNTTTTLSSTKSSKSKLGLLSPPQNKRPQPQTKKRVPQ